MTTPVEISVGFSPDVQVNGAEVPTPWNWTVRASLLGGSARSRQRPLPSTVHTGVAPSWILSVPAPLQTNPRCPGAPEAGPGAASTTPSVTAHASTPNIAVIRFLGITSPLLI